MRHNPRVGQASDQASDRWARPVPAPSTTDLTARHARKQTANVSFESDQDADTRLHCSGPAGDPQRMPGNTLTVGLEAVVVSAEGGEVRGGCGAGLFSAFGFGVVGVGDDVVDVAASGGARAPGVHAGAASSR